MRNVKTLIRSGKDALQVAIDFAHKHEMELFASIRMNDCHDSFLPPIVTLWKKAYPQLLIDPNGVPQDVEAHPLGLYVIAQDFSHKEVRDRKFEIIEEVCRRYDVDGVDLNFIRHPMYFSRSMRGEPANDDEIEIMTNFLRRIRKFADEQGTRRERPILLAAIVPDNFGLAKNIGLDLNTWIKDDLIDIVIPGLGYAPFSLPVKEFTDVAHPHGVKVYPCINRKAPQHIEAEHVSEDFAVLPPIGIEPAQTDFSFGTWALPWKGNQGRISSTRESCITAHYQSWVMPRPLNTRINCSVWTTWC